MLCHLSLSASIACFCERGDWHLSQHPLILSLFSLSTTFLFPPPPHLRAPSSSARRFHSFPLPFPSPPGPILSCALFVWSTSPSLPSYVPFFFFYKPQSTPRTRLTSLLPFLLSFGFTAASRSPTGPGAFYRSFFPLPPSPLSSHAFHPRAPFLCSLSRLLAHSLACLSLVSCATRVLFALEPVSPLRPLFAAPNAIGAP